MNIDATRAHVDAETMAAWADRALPAEEAAAVELHLSNCDRCQEVLAAFVRSAPAAGAVVIPFWARRPVQWSAAGLAAAAALVAMVWIGRPPALPAPESTVASRNVAPESPAVPAPTSVDQRQDKATAAPAANAPPAELRKERSAALQNRVAANDEAAKKVEGVAPPPPPITVTGAAPVVTPVATPVVTLGAARPGAMYESVTMDAITAIPIIEIVAPEPNPPTIRSTAGGAGRAEAGARAALTQNVAPARWRVVAGTHIERSLDAGATWTSLPIEPALTTTLRAGVATSQTNCWFVGRGGVVLVTNDGLTFRRVSVPEAIQLISVIATDALRATVTAVDGRTFSTIDGGLTWK